MLTADDRGLAGRGRPRGGRCRDRRARRLPRDGNRRRSRQQAKGGKVAQVAIDGRYRQGRSRRHVGQPAAELQAARAGRRPRRVRRRAAASSSRPTSRDHVEAVGARHRRRRRAGGAEPDPRPSRRQVLRLLLRGPDDEGPEVRDRRGLRLDRALEALHDRDDGARARVGSATSNSIRVYAKTTGLDENTIGTTTARPPYTPISMGLLAGPPQEPRKRTSLHHRHKDLGGKMMWTGAWRRPHSYGARRRRGGAARPPGARADRRLHARQDPRHRARRGRVPRPPLPEPLLRPQGRPHPLRRAHQRRGPDHGRRHRGASSTTTPSTSRPPRPAPTASTSGSPGGTRSGSWTSRSRT